MSQVKIEGGRAPKRARTDNLAPVSERKADMAQANAIRQLKRQVNSLIQKKEVKHLISAAGTITAGVAVGTDILSTWQVVDLSVSSQSVADQGHIGDSIKPSGWHCNFYLEGEDSYNTIRVVIFQAKGSFSAFSSANLPTPTGSFIPTLGNWTPTMRSNYYKIMYDRTHVVGDGAANSGVSIPAAKLFSVGGKLNHSIDYADGGGTSPEDGFIGIAFISDSTVTPYPEIFYNFCLVYTDA